MSSSSASSSSDDPLQDIIDNYNEKLGNVGPTAVAIQLGLMAALSLVTIILFSVLRPHNKLVYAPKWKYSDEKHRPPTVSNGYLSWISPLLKTKEEELLPKIGFDGICFLRYTRMCLWIFIGVAVIAGGILFPVNIVYNYKNVARAQRDPLNILTVQNVEGTILFVHVGVSYLIVLFVFYMVWRNYVAIVKLRWTYCRSDEYMENLASRSLMITNVRKKCKTDDDVRSLLDSRSIPYPTTSVHISRRVGDLPDLVKHHNETVAELEHILAKYLKNPNKVSSTRPTIRIGGFLGMGGQTVDAIDYLGEKIKRIGNQIETTRKDISLKKAENYGFASFAKVPYAHIVAKTLENRRTDGAIFRLAPVPSDIIWDNLSMTDGQRTRLTIIGFIVLGFFLAIYIAPLIVVSFISNLAAVTQFVPFLDNWSNKSSFTFAAAVGIVPPLLSMLLQLLLPMIMRRIARFQGARTKSNLDRYVLARYFFFSVATQFIIFTLIGVFYQLITEAIIEIGKKDLESLLNELKNLPKKIQSTYIIQSNYWLTLYSLRGFSCIFEIAQIISLAWVWMSTKIWGRTVRDIRESTQPTNFDYPVYYSNSLLLIFVGFVYAPLAPLVAVFAMVACFASVFVFKYQLMFVVVTKHESGGRLWRPAINRVLSGLIAMQLFMVLTVGLKQGWVYSVSAVPPIIAVPLFKIFLNRKFQDSMTWFIPTESEIMSIRSHMSDEKKSRLEKRFGHPCLHQPLFKIMIHKESEHLLAQVVGGLYEGDPRMNDKQGLTLAGLRVQAVAENEIELSRLQYLQDQWETGSMASTAFVNNRHPYDPEAKQEYYNMQAYMANGPDMNNIPSRPDSRAGDFAGEAHEMESLSKHGSRDSLINSGAAYAYHGRNASQSTVATLSTMNLQNPYDPGYAPPSGPQPDLQGGGYYDYTPSYQAPVRGYTPISAPIPSHAYSYSAGSIMDQGRRTPDANMIVQGRRTPDANMVMQGRRTPDANMIMQGRRTPDANMYMQQQQYYDNSYPAPPPAGRGQAGYGGGDYNNHNLYDAATQDVQPQYPTRPQAHRSGPSQSSMYRRDGGLPPGASRQ